MNLGRIVATTLTTLALLGTLGIGVAWAAPVNSPNSQTITVTCAPNSVGIDTLDIVTIDNNGRWTPGHIVAINGQPANETAIPLEFQFTFTSQSGTFSFDQVKPGNRNGITETVTCSGSQTFVDEQGNPVTLNITVTAFIAPRG